VSPPTTAAIYNGHIYFIANIAIANMKDDNAVDPRNSTHSRQ